MTTSTPNIDTLSLTFLGTGEHREKNINLLTSFHQSIKNECENNPRLAARLFDGPGSVPLTANSPNPIPGTYIYDADTDKKILIAPAISIAIRDALQIFHGRTVGDGLEHNIFEAILYLQNIIQKNGGILPKTLNLLGFSRGADTCVRLANAIYHLYPDISVNLFLIDQVPGPMRRNDPASYIIPPNVKYFDSAYMLHEYRPGFDAQDPNRYVFVAPHKTHVAIKFYYGAHSTGNRLSTNGSTNHTPLLLRDDLYKFCKLTGNLPQQMKSHPGIVLNRPRNVSEIGIVSSKVNPISDTIKYNSTNAHCQLPGTDCLTPQKRFELLCGMQENEPTYAVLNSRIHARDILFFREDYLHDGHLFANAEHRALFKELYPCSFNWFFEKAYGNLITKSKVIQELENLSHKPLLDNFLKKLANHKKFDINDIEATLSRPQGIPHNEPNSFRQPLVRNRATYLHHSLSVIANNYRFHAQKRTKEENLLVNELLRLLLKTKQLTAKKTITQLEAFIHKASLENKPGIIYKQLRILNSKPRSLKKIRNALVYHLKKYPYLPSSIKKVLLTVLGKINGIQDDNWTEKFYQEVKKDLKTLTTVLTKLTNVDNLIRSVREFLFEEKRDLHSQLLKDLNHYKQRNLFWDKVERIYFKVFRKELQIYSRPKHVIAMALREKLLELIKTGKKNDIKAIASHLFNAQHALMFFYKDSRKLIRGALDKILHNNLKEVGLQFAMAANPKNDTDNKLFL